MTKKNAPDLSDPSSPGGGSVCVGDDIADTDCSLEAPRKPRSEAQVAAFEKARAKRVANRSASAPGAPVAPPAAPTAPAPASAEPAAPAAKIREARTEKGKKRGYLMRSEAAAETHEAEEWYPPPPRRGYDHFVIVL
jgi:hypothetical protein